MNYQMDYFYGHEANQFTFFRIPKLLFSDERFIGLTSDAKILYGLMLDRMGLSVKNGWIDEKNHVYIYFTLEEAMEYMRIGKDKGVKLFAELDDEKGCGLIKKKKQGLGNPTLIYVMNFVSNIKCPEDGGFDPSNNDEAEVSESTEVKTSTNTEVKTSGNAEVKTSGNAEVKTSEKPKSGLLEMPKTALLETRSPNFVKTEVNNNDFNNNKNNNTDFSDNYPISSYQHRERQKKRDVKDEIRKEEHRFKKMIINFLVKDNTLFVFDDICSATHSWEHDYDRDLIRAFWVVLDFWDSVIANGRGTYPAKITFQTANESFDIIVANWGSEASLNEYFNTYEDGECRHIVLIEDEEQIDKIKFKDIVAFCIVDNDGKVSYYRKEG